MRKFFVLAAAAATLAVGVAAAQASCHSFRCLKGQLRSLRSEVSGLRGQVSGLTGEVHALTGEVSTMQTQLASDTRDLGTLANCLTEFPVTDYGDPMGTFGYVFDPGGGLPPFDITALDVTAANDTVGAWVLADSCNTQPTPATRGGARRGSHPIAHLDRSVLLAPLRESR